MEYWLSGFWASENTAIQLPGWALALPLVALGAGAGGVIYVACGFLLRVPELDFLRRRFRLTRGS